MINSAEDARRFADFMKFPPLGRRSWGPRAALALSGLIGPAYLHSANASTLAIAMIETREALGALDDILGAPGIDGVFVGPFDLSIALSAGSVVDPSGAEVEAALSRIVERARGARQVRRPLLRRRRARQGGAGARLRLVLGVDRPDAAARRRAQRTRRGAVKRTGDGARRPEPGAGGLGAYWGLAAMRWARRWMAKA